MRFRDHKVMGDILELAGRYRTEGADELVFYDITASPEQRSVDRGWVLRVASVLDIPFCVAGGIRSVEDAEGVLNAGAEKISVNSPALSDPDLIGRLARRFGSQCVVIGIDSQTVDGEFVVYQFTGDPNRSVSTMTAPTASPHCWSGTATTATSDTAGCSSNTSSISPGEMFSPPRTITSSERPSRYR